MNTKIRLEMAQQMLLEFNDDALWEKFIEMLHEFFSHNILGVLAAHDVEKDDGTLFTDTDEEQWYDDEIRNEFLDRCYQQISNDIYEQFGIEPEQK